ncbi:MAG: hypothetical protein ACPGSW_06860 [Phaeobacter italicus]
MDNFIKFTRVTDGLPRPGRPVVLAWERSVRLASGVPWTADVAMYLLANHGDDLTWSRLLQAESAFPPEYIDGPPTHWAPYPGLSDVQLRDDVAAASSAFEKAMRDHFEPGGQE